MIDLEKKADKYVVEFFNEEDYKQFKLFNTQEEAKSFALSLTVRNNPTIYGIDKNSANKYYKTKENEEIITDIDSRID